VADFEKDNLGGNESNAVYIAIRGKRFLQIFPTNYVQKNHCTMIGSPSEKGVIQFDNKVIQPTTVQFTGIVKSSQKDVFTDIRATMKQIQLENIICQFKSKAGRIDNMILESIEEIGESSRYDGIEIKVTMQEYLEHNVTQQS
jgi:hypothetical protein